MPEKKVITIYPATWMPGVTAHIYLWRVPGQGWTYAFAVKSATTIPSDVRWHVGFGTAQAALNHFHKNYEYTIGG